jgi:hypothetical protein
MGNSLTDRKDIRLFDYLRKAGEKYDDNRIFSQLYGSSDKNAFYRLKNRLLQDLNRSLTIQHFDDDETIHLIHLIALAKFFFNKNNYKATQYYLRKAESKAIISENYELLDFIYSELIRFSQEDLSVNPEVYIKKRKENRRQVENLRSIDDILAAINYRLKITQNFSSGKKPVLDLLEKTVRDFAHDPKLKKSSVLRFRLYLAVSKILLQRKDYVSLEKYLLRIYHEFDREKLFSKSNHDTKLQMLTYLVNTLFKNEKIKQSLQYTQKLKDAMEEYHHLHYDKYLFFYYNSLVINYSVLDKKKAIAILSDLRDNEKMRSNPFYELFIYLNLAVLWFDLHDYKTSIKNLGKLYLLDGYKTAGPELKFKISLAELVIRYELNDMDVLEYKIRQVRKDYKSFLEKKENKREKEIIEIITELIQGSTASSKGTLKERIKKFIAGSSKPADADSEIISYTSWLKEKIA